MKKTLHTTGRLFLLLAALTLFLHSGHSHAPNAAQDTHQCQVCKVSVATADTAPQVVSPILWEQFLGSHASDFVSAFSFPSSLQPRAPPSL